MSALPTDAQPACRPADQLEQGKFAIVVDLDAEPRDVERLNSLGLCVGATFRVQAAAPLFRIQPRRRQPRSRPGMDAGTARR